MRIWLAIAASALVLPAAFGQTRPPQKRPAAPSAAADRLGMTCPQILEISSTDWVAKFTQAKGATPESTTRAIAAYGKCYDLRTSELAASLAKKRKSPSKAARVDFDGFEAVVKHFTLVALADVQPPPGAVKTAYAALYEKQFRYEFYRGCDGEDPALTPDENDQFGKAKNRFGELLGLEPEDKAREIHEAFGEIVGTHQASQRMKSALYLYAIFILEPPSEKPFARPPF